MPKKTTASKAVPSPKKPKKAVAVPPSKARTVPTLGRKSTAARNADIRDALGDYTIAQMVALFKHLDPKSVVRLKKAVGKLDAAIRQEEIRKTQAEIDKLTKKLKIMKGDKS